MRRLVIALAIVTSAACASASRHDIKWTSTAVDTTGLDVARWDSLSKTYFNGPVPIDPVPFVVPVPRSMLRTKLVAVLAIDSTGRVTRISVVPPRDRAFGAWLVTECLKMAFRPATARDGTRINGFYRLQYQF